MTDVPGHVSAFLDGIGWEGAALQPLAGDASRRRYLRLTRADGATAVLMDAPPALCGTQADFLRLAGHLRSIGLSPPEILRADLDAGLLLLEDFGDRLFAQEAERSPEAENRVYEVAIDVLIHLRRPPPAGLREATPEYLAEIAMLCFDQYAAGAGQPQDRQRIGQVRGMLRDMLSGALTGPAVLVLRDYHAENLVWRTGQAGLARAGILDFQDALSGHPAYDLVSLLQDARRDLRDGLEEEMQARYAAATGIDRAAFALACHAVAVQRHLRILGVFARLSREMGKPGYLDHLPRTWAHLIRALGHPALEPLARELTGMLPPPTQDVLARLREPAP